MRQSTTIPMLLIASTCVIAGHAVGGELYDPMRPANAVDASANATAQGQIRVEAILNDGERRLAIVNGRLVREGDHIGTATVESISASAVRFNRSGRSELISLPVSKLEVRRPAALPKEPS